MKKLFFWLLAVFGILFIIFFAFYIFINALFDDTPIVPENAYLKISLSGSLPEYAPEDFLQNYLGETTIDIFEIRQALKMAAVDDRIKAVLLSPGPVFAGYAKLQEIDSYISEFKKSGKPVIAHLEYATTKDFYAACSADSLFLSPAGSLLLTGVRAEVTFYKGLLDFVGIEADFESIGKYKNAPDIYTKPGMTDSHREVVTEIVNATFSEIIEKIALKRNLTQNDLHDMIENTGGFTPAEALEQGLIDGTAFYSEMTEKLPQTSRLKPVSVEEYSRLDPTDFDLQTGSRVAVIFATGTIFPGDDGDDPAMGKIMGADQLIKNIEFVSRLKSVKAIILKVDSPGGSALASEQIWHALDKAREEKPLIAVISDVGASGGYMLASAADTILAQKNSVIGSIGVFAGKFSLEKLYKKFDVETELIKRGKNANLFSVTSKFSPSERSLIRKLIMQTYVEFREKVAAGRKFSPRQIDELAQGRVWLGRKSMELGLIDTIGGMDEAISLAKQLSGIPEDEDPDLLVYPRSSTYFRQMLGYIHAMKHGQNWLEVLKFRLINSKPLALLPYHVYVD